jgi:photosystem II stability/assembly factor-like uncharacterized protein
MIKFQKLTILVAIFIVFILVQFNAKGQSVTVDPNAKAPNFTQIQQQFTDYFKNIDKTQKGTGYKPFKRWEWFWGQRTFPTGEFPNPMVNYIEFNDVQAKFEKYNKINRIEQQESWSCLGPMYKSDPGDYLYNDNVNDKFPRSNALGRISCCRVKQSDNNTIYAGTALGGFWITTNGGFTWTSTTDNLGSLGISDIAIDPNNSNIIYIATGDADALDAFSIGIMKSTDGGYHWNQTGLNFAQSDCKAISRILIRPDSSNVILAGTSNGIYKSYNYGQTWKLVYQASDYYAIDPWKGKVEVTANDYKTIKDMEFKPNNPNIIYASYNSIVNSTNGGETWKSSIGIPNNKSIMRIALSVTPANPNIVYAVAVTNQGQSKYYFEGFYKSTNSGISFNKVSSTPNILGWDSLGNEKKGQAWYDLSIAANQVNQNVIYVGGVNIWKSTDGGENWENVSQWQRTIHADQHEIYYVPNSNIIYVSNDGGLYRTKDDFSSWEFLSNRISNSTIYRVGLSQLNYDKILCGFQDNGTKLHLSPNDWHDIRGGDGMTCFFRPDSDNVIYTQYPHGDFCISHNGGKKFKSTDFVNSSWLSPMTFNDDTLFYFNSGRLSYFVEYGHLGNPTFGVYKDSPYIGGVVDFKISYFNPKYMYMCGVKSNNIDQYFYRTKDRAANWDLLTIPTNKQITNIEINPTNPEKLWISCSGYSKGDKVYYSSNGGNTWVNISGSLPNVPVNCIKYQKGYYNRIYVGTDIGVFYRDDYHSDWVSFNNGFPNVCVMDLQIQESINYLYAGTFGRGLWSTPLPKPASMLAAPTLTSPINNANNIGLNPKLTWSSVNDAFAYTIQYTTNMLGVWNEVSSNNTYVFLSNLISETKYYWRVKAKQASATSPWSTIFSFTTSDITLNKPELIYPVDNALNCTLNQTVKWLKTDNALSYIIQYSPTSTWATYEEVTSETFYKILNDLLPNNKYYWKVKAVNGDNSSPWSDISSFTTTDIKLTTPTLVIPGNNAANRSYSTLTFSWKTDLNANEYIFQLSTLPNFARPEQYSTKVNNIKISLLDKATKYYWRVKSKNGNFESGWSLVRSFTTALLKEAIEDQENNPIISQNTIKVAPNPLTNRSEISITTVDGNANYLVLYNLLGLKVKEFQIPSGAVNVQFEFNRENLPAGVYMLVLSNSDGNVSELLFIE